MKKILLVVFVLIPFVIVSCSTSTSVSRVDSSVQIDLTGDWNENDVAIVSNKLVGACLSSPRIAGYEEKNGRLPIVVVGKFRNQSEEHIDTSIIVSKMQNALINSGVVDFIASKSDRELLRDERLDQALWADENQAKEYAMAEDAADYMLQGSVKSIIQKDGKKSVRTYFVYAELIDLESARIVWTGEDDSIKKYVEEPDFRW